MKMRRLSSFLPGFVSLLLALLGGVVLFNNLVISNLTSFIINVSLDPQRAQLIAALTMAARSTHTKAMMPFKEAVSGSHPAGTRTVKGVIGSSLGTLIMLVLILLASGSSDLFIFSPDIGLHTPPLLHTSHGPTHGTIVQDEV